jgi:hypothetical protein
VFLTFYLLLSFQVSPSFRTAINIPQQIWPAFVNKLHSMAENLISSAAKSGDIKEDWNESVTEDDDKKEQTTYSEGTAEKLEQYSLSSDYLE